MIQHIVLKLRRTNRIAQDFLHQGTNYRLSHRSLFETCTFETACYTDRAAPE